MFSHLHILLCYFLLHTFAVPLSKRESQGYTEISLEYSSSQSMYYIKGVTLGTASQSLNNVVIDTGSSDLVLSSSTFNISKSSTYEGTDEFYENQYGSSDAFVMEMATDTLEGYAWSLENFTFAISNVSEIDSFWGVLGIGYMTEEAMNEYPNLPAFFKDQGLTNSMIFSIKGTESNPSIVFGGIDKNAYTDPLYKTPIMYEVGPTASRSYYNVLAVTVNFIKIGSTYVSDEKLMYTIDSGSNALAVTEPIFNNILTILEDFKSIDNTTYFLLSSVNDLYVDIDITGIFVQFPLADLIDQIVLVDGTEYVSLRLTYVGIGTDSYEGVLPNSLLKYYYTVFDLENNQILIANYSTNTNSDIISIDNPDSYPVSTQTAPSYSDIYTSYYQSENEIVLKSSIKTYSSSTTSSSTSFQSVVSSYFTSSSMSDSTTEISTSSTISTIANPTKSSNKFCYAKLHSR